MNFAHYQQESRKTAMYPGAFDLGGLLYCTLGLCGESGEIAEKVKKIVRDSNGIVSDDTKRLLLLELGDVLWYVSNLCTELGGDFSAVAQGNLDKLFSRKERGVIQGSGDVR